jgi:hypothetical protein
MRLLLVTMNGHPQDATRTPALPRRDGERKPSKLAYRGIELLTLFTEINQPRGKAKRRRRATNAASTLTRADIPNQQQAIARAQVTPSLCLSPRRSTGQECGRLLLARRRQHFRLSREEKQKKVLSFINRNREGALSARGARAQNHQIRLANKKIGEAYFSHDLWGHARACLSSLSKKRWLRKAAPGRCLTW